MADSAQIAGAGSSSSNHLRVSSARQCQRQCPCKSQRTEHWGQGGMRAAAAPALISLPAFEALVLSPTTDHQYCIERFAAADHQPIHTDTRYLVYQLRTKYCFLNRFTAKRTPESSSYVIEITLRFCGSDFEELMSHLLVYRLGLFS